MVFSGEFKNGLKDGFGTIYYKESRIEYEGQFSKGFRHGTGVITDGNYWIKGHFDHDRRHGIFTTIY